MIDIRSALKQGLQQLNQQNPESSLESELLLCSVLNKDRAYLYTHPEQVLEPSQVQSYQNLISQRAQGTPIAYITGSRAFWSLNLQVNQHTLIPRHETELIVELALQLIPNQENISVLDLGTGSGAIALALAKERPHWHVDACDLSKDALEIAQENANNHHITNVQFHHSDWFKHLPSRRYHAIVANPPYIDAQDPHLEEGDLRFEPRSALVSGQKGLADLQYIMQQAVAWLHPTGLLLMEHGYKQKSQINAILNELGYRDIRCWQDFQGHDRVSGGWHP